MWKRKISTDKLGAENVINEIREFLSACPYLEGRLININYLGSGTGAVSLENISSNRFIKEYTDGERLCGARFCLAVRQTSSQSLSSNRVAAEILESVSVWLDEQNRQENLPKLGETGMSVEIVLLKSPAMKSVSDMAARHELMFEVHYIQEK